MQLASTSPLIVPTTRLPVGDRAFYMANARIWNNLLLGIIFVHVQVPAQDTTSYQQLSRQLPPITTNCFCPASQNSVFSFDVVMCPCSNSDITPAKSVL